VRERRAIAGAIVVAATGAAVAIGVTRQGADEGARCGAGFVARGARCVVDGEAACPERYRSPRGCALPDARVLVPAASMAVGPSDWEAEGRVQARTLHVAAFRIDAFEATRGQVADATVADPLRAASGLTLDDARRYCAARGGRLPSEDEWIVAAASAVVTPRRYPWGDTGAVCRRAAWGLAAGPCAHGADGPDTVGAHPDGDTPLGLHDLAGNVAEWVAEGFAKGGSWSTASAADLRIWSRLEVDPSSRDARVGVRCVYAP
jgi:formylglycine-generating enzyme required for sulfatase activity